MSEPYDRLDAAMGRRRLDVGLKTWRDLAVAAGISYETLRATRKGEGQPADATIYGLERALRWKTGSIGAILTGRQPTPLPNTSPASPAADGQETEVQRLRAEVAEQREQIAAMLERLDHLEQRTDV